MGRKQTAVLLIAFFIAACTGKKYLAPNFKTIAATHKKIAVLPFTIDYTGRVAKTISSKDISVLNNLEGLAFQQSMYNMLLASNKKTDFPVSVQPLKTTNLKLKTGEETQDSSGSYYCKLLGVDAVIVGNMSKNRLYTNLGALGVDLPSEIYSKLKADSTDLNTNLPQIPGNAERTYVLKATTSIIDNNNTVLWKYTDNLETKWSANEVKTTNRLMQLLQNKFPYSIQTVN